jgi:hypothetical protein
MDAFHSWIEQHHSVVLLAVFLWVGGFVLASILLRLRAGRPIITRAPEHAVFLQRSGSGRSERSWLTRLGGANNCLMVAVTEHELHIVPMFPFNLMFMPEVWDLEHRIRRRDIRSVTPGSGRWVRIEWQSSGAGRKAFRLRVRQPEALLQALG